ncbi:hypothetical protein ADN00_15120 [Ornatilinea apprima]|uniref:UvrD-like helicase ATP-binding domain-containing protein n=1 Tax=Ornatilinea apprima TaxID=1134406 RepID=A0A0P6WQ05_9CHLR|nr:UvrD-helicase domain-containing protein [Ornatilinea apprima]KPL72164.1 hypothetical protein ADN00_15120 [Ornatilinea apprima]
MSNQDLYFTAQQIEINQAPLQSKIFVEGPPGCGKTTAAVQRSLTMIASGIPAESILVLVPQRTLGLHYTNAYRQVEFMPGAEPDVVTLGGLGQRMVQLFWPLVAERAGFQQPLRPPTFLTLETAQYYLARIVFPLIEKGYFQSAVINKNRLLSQILDNLNKAAVVGFDYQQTSARLKSAYPNDPAKHTLFDQAQECAQQFRKYCLAHHLLDFSLQYEVFHRFLWGEPAVRGYLNQRYRHLIFDNVEEDVPITHDIVAQWLPELDSALLLYDQQGGYRLFLGADTLTSHSLARMCAQQIECAQSLVTSPATESLQSDLAACVLRESQSPDPQSETAVEFSYHHFFPQMIDQVAEQIASLVKDQAVPPGQIAVLSPFLSDSLRFSLVNRLQEHNIASRSHRPSRSLREEPAARCLLTWAQIAHPAWQMKPDPEEFRSALIQTLDGLDWLRAHLLGQIVYSPNRADGELGSFYQIKPPIQDRITHLQGQRYEALRAWLQAYRAGEPVALDVFLSRFFGEVLSQPGYAFHNNMEAASVAYRLVESVQKFRRGVPEAQDFPLNTGFDYLNMVNQGVFAAQYLQPYQPASDDAVLIMPAYTFLMTNHPVRVQFWLNIGSRNWWERIDQPLTHPYILSREWPSNQPWTDADDWNTNQKALERLVRGLIRRCSEKVIMTSVEIDESGQEQKGPLMQAAQSLVRRLNSLKGAEHD